MNISPWRKAVITEDVKNDKGAVIAAKDECVEARITPLTFLTALAVVEVKKEGETLLVSMESVNFA